MLTIIIIIIVFNQPHTTDPQTQHSRLAAPATLPHHSSAEASPCNLTAPNRNDGGKSGLCENFMSVGTERLISNKLAGMLHKICAKPNYAAVDLLARELGGNSDASSNEGRD